MRRGSSASAASRSVVGLDLVDRGEAQPRQVRNVAQDLPHEAPQPHAAGEIAAVGGEVDAGQHDLA